MNVYAKIFAVTAMCVVLFLVGAYGQSPKPPESAQAVAPTDGPPKLAWSWRFDYDGSGNMIYRGYAQSTNKKVYFYVDTATLVNCVVAANVCTLNFGVNHGLKVGNKLFLENWTGDADLNTSSGYIVASVVDGDTVTIATTSVANGTYTNPGARVWTEAPRSNDTVWSLQKYTYDGSNRMINMEWADGSAQNTSHAWDSRTTYAYQ